MLDKTFCHVQGISVLTEKKILEEVQDWDDFVLKCDDISCLSEMKKRVVLSEINFSKNALEESNLVYFRDKLPPKEHYRLSNFGKIAYVDIETTGLSKYTDKITTIGIYDGNESKVFIRNHDLDEAKERLKDFDIIVTFNGKQFDLPFIEQHFGEKYDFVHLDLRFMLAEFGLKGGLKRIERELGVTRDEEVEGVDGFEAVRLWRRYERFQDEDALRKLVKYNIEDIENLETLLSWYLKRKEDEFRK